MRHLNLKVVQQIVRKPKLFFFLDYDGTLTPIASGPSEAKLSAPVRGLLRDLAGLKDVRVAIVSGRSLANLKQYVRIPGLIYSGNHGFEIEGRGLSYVHPEALAFEKLFFKLTQKLRRIFAPFRGILVEHKTFSISVHYRHVRSCKFIQKAKEILLNELEPFKDTSLALAHGKKVWEIRPTAEWHKGETVLWLMRQSNRSVKRCFFPVYVGDDTTDEDAFRAIRNSGMGIKVTSKGKIRSHAKYYVRSTAEAVRFLRQVVSLRRTRRFENV